MEMVSDSEAFLRGFHARRAGATTRTLQAGRTVPGGLSSYDLLVRRVPRDEDSAALTVLDLACGDGYLLQRVREEGLPVGRLIGVDMSEAELAAARQRLDDSPGEPPAELFNARAQDLPLPTGSVDIVLCHMALMLLDDIEAVVAEIARVLKPGGLFSAVVGGAGSSSGAWAELAAAVHQLVAHRAESPLRIGDPRTQTAEGLRALFSGQTGFVEPIEVEDVLLHLDGPPGPVWEILAATYWSELLTPEEWREVEIRVGERLEALKRPDGTVPCALPLRQVTCRRLG